MKLTTITKLSNGQYITTVPKAWLKSASNYRYLLLEWSWEWADNRESIVMVKLIDSRCEYIVAEGGINHQCVLEYRHDGSHKI